MSPLFLTNLYLTIIADLLHLFIAIATCLSYEKLSTVSFLFIANHFALNIYFVEMSYER